MRRLPPSVYSALVAGAEAGVSRDDNVTAFREIGLLSRIVADLPAEPILATRVMGQDLALPVLVSPTGVQAVHPGAEVAIARAAARAGTAMGLSSFASKPLAEVVAANPATFFQIYWTGGRERVLELLERAREAQAVGIIVTLDWSFAHRRDWGSPAIPESLNLRAMLRLAPEVLRRPRWLFDFARDGALPTLTAPNVSRPGQPAPSFFGAYGEWMFTPRPTWDDIAWLRTEWGGPLMIKGVAHPEDAARAADAGATAISVSNHGGNNLDGTPAPIRLLPAIVDAVGDEVEVVMDGGVRRGSDVVKALALGARAVMVGRAALWGLAANGEAGVANVFDILRAGILETLNGIGKGSIHDLRPDDLLIPRGFAVTTAAARARPPAGHTGSL